MIKSHYVLFTLLLAIAMNTTACHNRATTDQHLSTGDSTVYPQGTFGHDLRFLQQHDSIIVLEENEGRAQVAVSPRYQAKVFTTTAGGLQGQSFGWVNYKAFTAPPDAHMNAYGGENRLWLGPEGGPYSLYFAPGAPMTFDNWKTPAAFDTEKWEVTEQTNKSVTLHKDMQLTNYTGAQLYIGVDRTVEILSMQQIQSTTGATLTANVRAVAYNTLNTLTNKGNSAWTETSGMPCLWMLDMFTPSPSTVIILPFKKNAGTSFNQVATTDYFGPIGTDRLQHTDDVLLLKADGKSRGKIGIKPAYAREMLGSYDAQAEVLTVVLYEPERGAKYLNQEWTINKAPFSGDAVNAYNDGPLADGSQMGPFYEIETVSPAAFLQPGQQLEHRHAVYHFTGPETSLDPIAQQLLGVSIQQVKTAFPQQ